MHTNARASTRSSAAPIRLCVLALCSVLVACVGSENGNQEEPDVAATEVADTGDAGPDTPIRDIAEPNPDVVDEPDASPDIGDDTPDADEPDLPPEVPPLEIALTVISDAPTAEDVLSGIAIVTAEVTGGAGAGEILGVEFYVDAFRVDTDLIPPYTTALNTSLWGDGVHTVSAFTADRTGGNASIEVAWNFDNSAPVFLGRSPEEGDTLFFEDGPLEVSVEVDDPSAIELVTFRGNGLMVGELTGPPYEITADWSSLFIDEESLPTGVFVQIDAVDFLGQRTTEAANIRVLRRLEWTHETLGEIWGAAAFMPDGNIVFANKNNKVVALRLDGSEAWSVTTNGAIDMAPAVHPDNGRVYVGTSAGTVYAYDPGGGNPWTTDISSPPGGDLVYAHDTVYVAGFNGVVHALNAGDGSTRWTVALPDQILAAPTVADDGTVYIGCQDDNFYALRDGGIVWSAATGDEVWAAAALGPGGTVFFGSNDGWVYAVDSDGSPRWSVEVEGQIWGRLLVTDEPALYVSSTSRHIHRLDPATGRTDWHARTEGMTNSSPVEGPDGTIYVGTTLGTVFALSPDGGEVQWSFGVGDAIHATVLLSEDRLYIGSTNRTFYSLRIAPPPAEE